MSAGFRRTLVRFGSDSSRGSRRPRAQPSVRARGGRGPTAGSGRAAGGLGRFDQVAVDGLGGGRYDMGLRFVVDRFRFRRSTCKPSFARLLTVARTRVRKRRVCFGWQRWELLTRPEMIRWRWLPAAVEGLPFGRIRLASLGSRDVPLGRGSRFGQRPRLFCRNQRVRGRCGAGLGRYRWDGLNSAADGPSIADDPSRAPGRSGDREGCL